MMVSLEKPGTPQELVHFGTKGMRWGVRNEEKTSGKGSGPKPLSARKERRAKEFEAKAAKAQAKIDEISGTPRSKRSVARLEKHRDQQLKNAKDVREGHLTDKQKKVLIGAGIVAVALATYGAYKMTDSGQTRALISRGSPFKKNDLLSRKMSSESLMREVVKPINPGYGKGEFGTRMNCRRCTFAYEMRRRGLDVKATRTHAGTGQLPTSMLRAIDPKSDAPLSKFGIVRRMVQEKLEEKSGPGTVTNFMTQGKGSPTQSIGKGVLNVFEPHERSQWIFEQLAKNPEGSRGELGMHWKMGGAHSMAWEVINGVPRIFDTQSGHAYDATSFTDVAKNIVSADQTRLDNLPLNSAFLRRWVANV
jgi:hypothetical protein